MSCTLAMQAVRAAGERGEDGDGSRKRTPPKCHRRKPRRHLWVCRPPRVVAALPHTAIAIAQATAIAALNQAARPARAVCLFHFARIALESV